MDNPGQAVVGERGQPVIEDGNCRLNAPPWPEDLEERRLADLKQWALDNPDNPMVELVMQQVNGIEPNEEEFGAYWNLYGTQQSKRHNNISRNSGGHNHANKCHWDAASSRQLLAVMNQFQESLNEMDRRGIRVTIPSKWTAISQKLPNRFGMEPAKFATSCKVHYANLCRVYRGQKRTIKDMELSHDLCQSIAEYELRCQYVRQTRKRQRVKFESFVDGKADQFLDYLVNSIHDKVDEPGKQRRNCKSKDNIITMTVNSDSKLSSKVIQKSSSQASKEIIADDIVGRVSSSSCSRKVQLTFKEDSENALSAAGNTLPRRLVHRNTTSQKPEDYHEEDPCACSDGTSSHDIKMNEMLKHKARGDDPDHFSSRDHDSMDEDDNSRDHLVLDGNTGTESALDALGTTKLKGKSIVNKRAGAKQATKKGSTVASQHSKREKMDRNQPASNSRAVIGVQDKRRESGRRSKSTVTEREVRPAVSPIRGRKTSLTRNDENRTHLQLLDDERSADGDKLRKRMTTGTILSTKSKDRDTIKIRVSERRRCQDHTRDTEENQDINGKRDYARKEKKGRNEKKPATDNAEKNAIVKKCAQQGSRAPLGRRRAKFGSVIEGVETGKKRKLSRNRNSKEKGLYLASEVDKSLEISMAALDPQDAACSWEDWPLPSEADEDETQARRRKTPQSRQKRIVDEEFVTMKDGGKKVQFDAANFECTSVAGKNVTVATRDLKHQPKAKNQDTRSKRKDKTQQLHI